MSRLLKKCDRANYFGFSGDLRLVLVLSGISTALSVLVLAEVYELDRDLLACSIAMGASQ